MKKAKVNGAIQWKAGGPKLVQAKPRSPNGKRGATGKESVSLIGKDFLFTVDTYGRAATTIVLQVGACLDPSYECPYVSGSSEETRGSIPNSQR